MIAGVVTLDISLKAVFLYIQASEEITSKVVHKDVSLRGFSCLRKLRTFHFNNKIREVTTG